MDKYFIVQDTHTKFYYVKQRRWPFGSKFIKRKRVEFGYIKQSFLSLKEARLEVKHLEYMDKFDNPIYKEIIDG